MGSPPSGILMDIDEDVTRTVLRPANAGARPGGGRPPGRALQGARRSCTRVDPQPARRCGRGVRLRLRRRARPGAADGVAPPEGSARRRARGVVAARDVGVLPPRPRRGRRVARGTGWMTRLVFTGPHAALAAALGAAAYSGTPAEGAVAEAIEELDLPPAHRVDAPLAGDEVVDTAAWNLPEPVGLCLEEVRELCSAVEERVSRLR